MLPDAPPSSRDRQGPLSGLRVIEMAAIGPVPMAGMLLSDLGADVVRIDRLAASELGVPMPPRYDVNARGRRSVALDLKCPAGVDAVRRLIDGADVLLEGFRPGVMERLGLDPAECRARNPRLVIGRMTGFGQTGPLAQAAGHDLNYIALSGALHAIGPAGGKPVPPLNLVGDYGGGALYLAFGVMAALFERQRSGQGQVVDAAMVDGAASLASIFFGLQAAGRWPGPRGTNLLDGGAPFYDTYETADGRFITLAALEPKFYARLLAALGLGAEWRGLQHDTRRWPELRSAIANAVRSRSRDAWCTALEGTDVCFAPVLSFDEAPRHAHAAARESFIQVDGVVQPAPAPRFDRTPAGRPQPAPLLGEHTAAVLTEAGFTPGEIRALCATVPAPISS
jgi:alpha-methylacyl-CoA racemase